MGINMGFFVSGDLIQYFFDQKELQIKMSSVMTFTFNAVELCIVTMNESPWTSAREVCKELRYNKKAKNIVKNYCSKENYSQKYQMSGVPTVVTPVDWPEDSQKFDIYINEEGMYELLFSSQQPKAKEFRKHCCNLMFPHVQQQLTNKMEEDHQQAIKEKDLALAQRDNQIQPIQHENVALQAQRDVYQAKLRRCQDQIRDLIINRHVPRGNDPGKDNIVMIIEKNTTPEEFYEYPYYITRIQPQFTATKKRWFRAQYPHHRSIIGELDDANNIHAFNRFEEEEHVERFQCHFRLVNLARDALYALATPTIHD